MAIIKQQKMSNRSITLMVLLAVLCCSLSSLVVNVAVVDAFHPAASPCSHSATVSSALLAAQSTYSTALFDCDEEENDDALSSQQQTKNISSRRSWLLSKAPQNLGILAISGVAMTGGLPSKANAAATIGEVTDKVFVDVSGLSVSASAETGRTQRIVLGLFGTDAPSCVGKLKQLFSSGLPAPCKPLKEDFLIQREQLEANKVYRSCTESIGRGVTYDYAQIWRIVKNERIDFGSVSGKYIAREFPTWGEKLATVNNNADDYTSTTSKYLVAVRKGSDSGFGYTIFPTLTAFSNKDFLENYIVVGTVVEGEDVVAQINEISVVSSAKNLNYMAIVGGGGSKNNAPSKSCRYGGPMYCNENKPLTKLTMFRTGIL